MQVYSKNKYRFLKPDSQLLKAPGVDMAKVLGKQEEFKDAFFELEPEKFQETPDWIKDDAMFQWALRDGDIKIVVEGTDTSIPLPPSPSVPAPAPAPDATSTVEEASEVPKKAKGKASTSDDAGKVQA